MQAARQLEAPLVAVDGPQHYPVVREVAPVAVRAKALQPLVRRLRIAVVVIAKLEKAIAVGVVVVRLVVVLPDRARFHVVGVRDFVPQV